MRQPHATTTEDQGAFEVWRGVYRDVPTSEPGDVMAGRVARLSTYGTLPKTEHKLLLPHIIQLFSSVQLSHRQVQRESDAVVGTAGRS
jgi:hypothetical protein